MAFILTPQCFSTSSLVFGPVLIHTRKILYPTPFKGQEKMWDRFIYSFIPSLAGRPLTSKFNPSINLFCNVFNKPITPCQLTPPRLYLFGQVNRFSYHLTFTLWNSFLHPLLVSSLTLFLCQTQIYVTLVQI